MKRVSKRVLGVILAISMLIPIIVMPVSAVGYMCITDLDISKCQKVYFKCVTNKDFTQYEVGEDMKFSLTLYADGKRICSPYFKYTLTGDDGQSSSGFVDAKIGSATIITSLSIAGAVRLVVEPADANKKVISNEKITKFEGGAMAGASEIRATAAEPLDFDDFWARKLSELDKCSPDLVSLEQITSGNSNFDCYIVKINCIGNPEMVATKSTYTAGVLTVPKNATAGSLELKVSFQGYGVNSVTPGYFDNMACLAVSAHSIDPFREAGYYNEAALGLSNYGFSAEENADPDTSYFTYMLLRDVQAVRFLKKYFGTEGGVASVDGIDTSSWKGLWNGEDIASVGVSQGGFQAIGVAALDGDVSFVNVGIAWFSDVAGNTVSTRIQSTLRPTYADGLRYLDTSSLAKRVVAPRVEMYAGTGDTLCPMYAIQAIYNNMNTESVKLTFKQGYVHGETDTWIIDSIQSKGESSGSVFGKDAIVYSGESDKLADYWYRLTGNDADVFGSVNDLVNVDGYTSKNYVQIVDFNDLKTSVETVDEYISQTSAILDEYEIDNYGIAITGDVGELGIAHRAILKMAADPSSSVHLIAFGVETVSVEDIAEAFSGALFGNQAFVDVEYKLIGENGKECSSLVLASDFYDVPIYPITVPLCAMKRVELSVTYKTPKQTGKRYGLATFSAPNFVKEIKTYDASIYSSDAGVIWTFDGSVLTIIGDDIDEQSSYAWNDQMTNVKEIVIEEGMSAIPAYAFSVPAYAIVKIPFSVKTIDENAFFGKRNFIIACYTSTAAMNFANKYKLSYRNLGKRYIEGNVIGSYNGISTVDNYWIYDTETKVLTVIANKSTGYNESGSHQLEGGWSEIIGQIEEVVLIGNMSKLTSGAFRWGYQLRKVTLPASIVQIDANVFEGCSRLETVCIEGRLCLDGVLDFSNIVGSNAEGANSFAKTDIFSTSVKAKGIVLGTKYSDSVPLVLGNLPDGIKTIYGNTAYLSDFCEANNLDFVKYGTSKDGKIAWTIEDSTLTVIGEGTLNDLGDVSTWEQKIKYVIIPKTITKIADQALASLTKLEIAVFRGDAPTVTTKSKPFGDQRSGFYISVASPADGFDDIWCGYTVIRATYVSGDMNEDGKIDARDAVTLAQYLASWSVTINEMAADVTGDGSINARDAVLLAQYLAKWEVDLVGPIKTGIEPGDTEVEIGDLFQ